MPSVSSVQATACILKSDRSTKYRSTKGYAGRRHGAMQLRRMPPLQHAHALRRCGSGGSSVFSRTPLPMACRASDQGVDERTESVIDTSLGYFVMACGGSANAPHDEVGGNAMYGKPTKRRPCLRHRAQHASISCVLQPEDARCMFRPAPTDRI